MEKPSRYIPALRFEWLTPLYDPLLRWVMREASFKRRLVQQTRIGDGHRVLDLGCGTGTLTILIKQAHPGASVVGVDGDRKVLDIARAKASRAGVEITFDHGMAFDLPYPDGSFDRVLSSLVMHHLVTTDKTRALREVLRVLKAGGEVHILDFGAPASAYTRLIAPLTHRLEEAADNIDGKLPEMMRAAGFDPVEKAARVNTIFGTLDLLRGQKGA